jgi:FKBP-type peptidyl-prolyl cis-trans isomerase FkpA
MRLLSCAAALVLAGCSAAPSPQPPAARQAPAPAPTARPSGLVYQSLVEGTGASPVASDTVQVHYKGTLQDGREFDSSYARGRPAEFLLSRVIPCWTEGVQLMKPGGKARLTCPPGIAYGERGAGGVIPPNATLTFEVELISVRR